MKSIQPTSMGVAIGWACARAYDGQWGFAAFILVFGIAFSLFFDGASARSFD